MGVGDAVGDATEPRRLPTFKVKPYYAHGCGESRSGEQRRKML